MACRVRAATASHPARAFSTSPNVIGSPRRSRTFDGRGPAAARWPRVVRAGEMTWDHRHVRLRDEHPEPRLEPTERAVPRPRALGEEDVRARLFDQAVTQVVERVPTGPFAPHRQRVHRAGGEGREHRRLEERVPRCQRQHSITQRDRQRRGDRHRIEVARVVRDHDERRRRGTVRATLDGQPVPAPQVAAHRRTPPDPDDRRGQPALALKAPETLARLQAVVVRRVVTPVVHRGSASAGEYPGGPVQTDPVDVADEVERGATRAAEAMLGGHVLDAVLYNPLVTLAALAFLFVGLAAPAWIRSGGRLPSLSATPPVPARIAIAVGLVGNWAWVLAREW